MKIAELYHNGKLLGYEEVRDQSREDQTKDMSHKIFEMQVYLVLSKFIESSFKENPNLTVQDIIEKIKWLIVEMAKPYEIIKKEI